jgi:hypothetical protein
MKSLDITVRRQRHEVAERDAAAPHSYSTPHLMTLNQFEFFFYIKFV